MVVTSANGAAGGAFTGAGGLWFGSGYAGSGTISSRAGYLAEAAVFATALSSSDATTLLHNDKAYYGIQ